MSKLRKRIEELKKIDPLFKDFELKPHKNNLDEVRDHILELFKKDKNEDLNESNNNSEETSEQI